MTTSYFLAVDVGTSRTAAATVRQADDGTLVATPFTLGRHADSTPSVIFVGEGELLFGDAAARRGIAQPERLIREFKRRIGDEIPIIAGDQQFLPEDLYAQTVAWVIDAVADREGGQPSAVSVAVPVTWTDFRVDLVRSALARMGCRDLELITEPVAAARHYESERPLEEGGILAVYDLGGGTFDAVLLRKEADGELEVVGEPVGIAAFGGSDFDDLVVRHAIAAAGLSASDLATDPHARVALAALRRECIDAKESLSFDSESVVPVLVGPGSATVRLTRAEFEAMIEEGIERTVDVLGTAFDATGVDLEDVEAILLTGGSSRIPRVAQLLSERFDRPIAVDADPKAIIALGAARSIAERELWAAYYADQEDADDADLEETVTEDRKKHRPRRSGRRWFGFGPATALAGGALMLAAGIAVSVGYPLIGGTSSANDSSTESSIEPSTLSSIEPSTSATAQPTPAAVSTAAAATPSYDILRDRLGIPSPAVAAPSPSTPLLSPASPSERITNVASSSAPDE